MTNTQPNQQFKRIQKDLVCEMWCNPFYVSGPVLALAAQKLQQNIGDVIPTLSDARKILDDPNHKHCKNLWDCVETVLIQIRIINGLYGSTCQGAAGLTDTSCAVVLTVNSVCVQGMPPYISPNGTPGAALESSGVPPSSDVNQVDLSAGVP